jgi:hypothetical protein
MTGGMRQATKGKAAQPHGRVLRLFDMAQIAAADLVSVRNVLHLLIWADMSRAHLVKDVCLQVRPAVALTISNMALFLPEFFLQIE